MNNFFIKLFIHSLKCGLATIKIECNKLSRDEICVANLGNSIVKRDTASLYGYSYNPKCCDSTGDIINVFLNPIAAIIKAAKGHKVEDTEPYQREMNRQKENFISELCNKMKTL